MNILVAGAGGLIGRRCVQALRLAGHRVVAGMRETRAGMRDALPIDFRSDTTSAIWRPRLAGIDVVINAVGILRESGSQTFEDLHVRAPQALFTACVDAGVRRVIQISALGADEYAATLFHTTKKRADDFLLALPIEATVVQPSLVFSDRGASTRLFARLATMPLLVLPNGGRQRIQPVALDDVAEGIAALVDAPAPPRRLAAVGPAPVTFRSYLQSLRSRLGLPPARVIALPLSWSRRLLRWRGIDRIADADALAMLQRDNVACAQPFAQLLRRSPMSAAGFIADADIDTLRRDSAVGAWTPLLRAAIAALWIGTGVVSLGLYPVADSLALLARTGLTEWPADIALVGAAALDIALGIATLVVRRRWLWSTQMMLILAYTIIITARLPEFWLHPYAPILKNIPLLAAIGLLRSQERR